MQNSSVFNFVLWLRYRPFLQFADGYDSSVLHRNCWIASGNFHFAAPIHVGVETSNCIFVDAIYRGGDNQLIDIGERPPQCLDVRRSLCQNHIVRRVKFPLFHLQ